ncbi:MULTISPECIES: DAHL domain-containing protein [unclassified Pseudomonas]|jgi:two-component system NtrC family sensor kinase|uniref:DAHL domain-containing protein n=1 Tax=unclassified Pseudomonas TaxID=196821 RepID=UPI00098AAB36|nr:MULTISPECIES: DAHL domain-containing protein [unclassified Pseudomonas]OOL34866.1 histidine kinase [Pseudomonas sp. FSL W5-0299]PMV85319.1 GHKL domain-containing protein [Pseudomonas sp. GW101-1A09]PMV91677.1 GHKL domain-containing protein [Pseudomonas sp. FW306-2-2C-B10A]PMV93426.1 GHKL domain-containing protein [Pseudomonas sp. GW460-C8]PMW05554.1 GHKL domain-containing protein [Pseudomonas sp. MPR-TSA4]
MKISRRRSVALLGIMALILASTLLFLYLKSNSNQTSTYTESRDLISRMKQLNAQWETEILKARIAINHNYDPLVTPLTEMTRLWERFDTMSSNHSRNTSPVWLTSHDAYLSAFEEKIRLVEQFKSHNAVLRNSLAFLPTAEDDIQEPLAQLQDGDKLQLQNIANDTYDLVLSTMEFAMVTSDDKAAEILVGLSKLKVNKLRLPEEFHSPLDVLNNHIELILREQPVVNRLLENIEAIPVAERLDGITDLLNNDQQRTDAVDQRYHFYMLVFSVLLVLLLVYLAIHLMRSFTVINRVNKALKTANDDLEKRVEERTRELKDTQSELLDTARQAGMAEIATNVLHNVGNVLNSVNISADLVSRKLRSSKAQGLGKAMQLINEHQGDLGAFLTQDAKGKLLPGYLNQLVDAIALEQQSMTDELAQLTKSVDHIKDIVATQQSYAGANSLMEPLHISELLEDALRMNSGALTRHHVTVVKEYNEVPQVMGDKHRLLLILINLISNAKYAMSDLSNRPRQMTLGVKIVEDSTLQISVKDDGEGIAPENMTRIFAHGFTTRKEGHGFGLHSCALAAIEMNGHLSAHSDGPGKGAQFTLQIPLKTVPEEA